MAKIWGWHPLPIWEILNVPLRTFVEFSDLLNVHGRICACDMSHLKMRRYYPMSSSVFMKPRNEINVQI